MRKRRVARHFVINGSRVDLVLFGDLFGLAVELARVGHFNRVVVVGIKTEHGNAGMREKLTTADGILDLLPVLLRNNAHGGFGEFIAAVLDNGGQRGNPVGIDNDFTELALRGKRHARAGRTAGSSGSARKRSGNQSGNGAHKQRTATDSNRHDDFSPSGSYWKRAFSRP